MSEHYTRNTEGAPKYCNRCGRVTTHAVHDARIGRCTEHESPHETKAQIKRRIEREKRERNPVLFS